MSLTEAIRTLHAHLPGRFTIDLEISVNKYGEISETGWCVRDSVAVERHTSCSLDDLVRQVTAPAEMDSGVELNAAVTGLPAVESPDLD